MSQPPAQAALEQAVSHHQAGRFEEALRFYAQVRRLAPKSWESHQLAGVAHLQARQPALAYPLFRQAISLKPQAALSWMCAGVALQQLGKVKEGEAHLTQAVKLDPRNAEAQANLGSVFANSGRFPQAIAAYEAALKIDAKAADAWTGLGTVHLLQGNAEEALKHHRRALELSPKHAKAGAAAGQALQQLNRTQEAIAAFDAHLRTHPDDVEAASQRLLLLNYSSELTTAEIAEAHFAFGRKLAQTVRPTPLAAPSQPAKRPLKIAFLSPDLRRHSVASFLTPLLQHLDRERFAVLLYHDHFTEDDTSRTLKATARVWRNFIGQADNVVEAQIRQDAPDILVDLAGHTGFNRLSLFARRLAPVQITYLGYPNTTGIQEMDFRITDAIADPVETFQARHTETLLHLPRTAWTYQPAGYAPPVDPPPSARGEPFTFGSFNALNKLSPQTLSLWSRLLLARPGARLLLKSSGMNAERVSRELEAAGIAPARVILLGPAADPAEHLRLYSRVDIALDPFPYHGTTTTCEALWMGVPVVTLKGDRHASRVGASLLTAIGHPEWVNDTEEAYLDSALKLASAPEHLLAVRNSLRQQMMQSPLLDFAGQAKALGDLLERAWISKCAAT